MNVVIDTNVLVSALRSNKGASFALLSKVLQGEVSPYLSVPLYIEYQDVLLRKGKVPAFSNAEIHLFLRTFCSLCMHQEIFFLWRPCLKDPKDDMVLELAVASRSSIIVTHNVRGFKGSELFGIKIFTPNEFLRTQGAIT